MKKISSSLLRVSCFVSPGSCCFLLAFSVSVRKTVFNLPFISDSTSRSGKSPK